MTLFFSRLVWVVVIVWSIAANATSSEFDLPKTVNLDDRFIFYSHGYIVEGDDPRPVHPEWGQYDYPGILSALSKLDAVIISTHRPAKSDPFMHAEAISRQVEYLLEQGVFPNKITIMGFSRGGFITAIASSLIKHPDINYIILAACTRALSSNTDVRLTGHVLSIFETSDAVGSCDKVVARAPQLVSSFIEISISTGLSHGAFYRPDNPWLAPVESWLAARTKIDDK
ncbi:alpha/beta hydrolase [Alteromonas ponticola]|uniref:Alpha/beta hydrolase n=1 Tax=Alteromonas ponticola TaxID=2720613 RepID=A0ABX1R2K9_9ALTE|nr:alpha/beta hydrolase [Alteromonas ponticola]NMH60692.1 alpha/beta hydrolase [Alteromonas ponticola]